MLNVDIALIFTLDYLIEMTLAMLDSIHEEAATN